MHSVLKHGNRKQLFTDMNRKCLAASILLWCRLFILWKNSRRIALFFQQIASGVPVLVPCGPARVWKGAGTQPFDLFHLQSLCCLVEGERQVSHFQVTGISCLGYVVAYWRVIPQSDSHAGLEKDNWSILCELPLVSMPYVFVGFQLRKLWVICLIFGGIFLHMRPQYHFCD